MNLLLPSVLRVSGCFRCAVLRSSVTKFLYVSQCQFMTHSVLKQKKSLSKDVKTGNSGFGKKVKEATKTTTYSAVLVIGLGVTGLMLYCVFRELIAPFSSQAIYTAAVEKCIAHPRVVDFLGDSIKSYGEESRRGRRQHISHLPYEVDGIKGMRLKFYLKGQRRTATVSADARETPTGFEFRYLFLQLDSYPYETVIIEDNRSSLDTLMAV